MVLLEDHSSDLVKSSSHNVTQEGAFDTGMRCTPQFTFTIMNTLTTLKDPEIAHEWRAKATSDISDQKASNESGQ